MSHLSRALSVQSEPESDGPFRPGADSDAPGTMMVTDFAVWSAAMLRLGLGPGLGPARRRSGSKDIAS